MPTRKLKDVVANRKFVSAAATHSAMDVAKLMALHNIGSVLILNGERLEGIVTERDVITRVVAPGRNPETVKVAEFMTHMPVVMSLDKPFGHALMAMAEGKFRHIPVVDGFKVVGVVSMRDALGQEHLELDRTLQALDTIVTST